MQRRSFFGALFGGAAACIIRPKVLKSKDGITKDEIIDMASKLPEPYAYQSIQMNIKKYQAFLEKVGRQISIDTTDEMFNCIINGV